MSDTRTRAQKLRAMAEQDVSPHGAEIARAKLATGGYGADEPPQRPPAAAAPAPQPFGTVWFTFTFTTNGTSTTTTGSW